MGLNRREMLKVGAFAATTVALPARRFLSGSPALADRIPTSRLPQPFTVPFAQPPIAQPVRVGSATDYYRVRMRSAVAEILPGLKTPVFAYNGTVPGPTFKVRNGRSTVVRFVNELPTKHPTLRYEPWTSTHLHGARSLPQFDGYASDITRPGQYKDYRYQNLDGARSIWYHDHGVHHTAENVYSGLLGSYHITDDIESALRLPRGEFDVQLTVGDAMFNADGSLLFSLDDHKGMWGDVILVNGRPWPVMKVKRRKYRFRVLCATVSRSFEFRLSDGSPLAIVATDGGLVPETQWVTAFRQASGERTDIVIDFSRYRPGQRVVLGNRSPDKNTDFTNIDKVMAFDIVGDAFDGTNNEIPSRPNPRDPVMALDPRHAVRTRTFRLHRKGGEWVINDRTWRDVVNSGFARVEAEPRNGDIEIWQFENSSGGWFHPMHVHLVDFKVLDRNGKPPHAWERGPKDDVYVGPNETVRVLMRFDGVGKYMFHCHNLIHEDHDMMLQFRVRSSTIPEFDPFSSPALSLPERSPL